VEQICEALKAAEAAEAVKAPSCHVCGAIMVRDGFRCPGCKATTQATEPLPDVEGLMRQIIQILIGYAEHGRVEAIMANQEFFIAAKQYMEKYATENTTPES
jgi:hypothetical protein